MKKQRRIRGTMKPELLEARHLLAADPFISELMASNGTTLLDGDGNSPDWIEIQNRGDMTIDMSGWYLTDSQTEPTKWPFPSVSVDAGDHLVVFASGQSVNDYVDAGGNLHTNFRLSGGGEYLALVEPNGTTVAYEFNPEFPQQLEDVSYGLETDASVSETLVTAGATTKILVPDGPVSDWTSTAFNDSTWTSGPTGVGFENLDSITLPGGLVTFFGFDDQNPSTTAFETISGNDQPVTGTADFVDGQFNGAIEFDGATNIDLSQPPTGMRDGFTMSLWMQPDAANRTLISGLATNLSAGFWFGYNQGGPWLGIAAGADSAPGSTGTWNNVSAPGTMNVLEQWYHVAVTFDPADTAEEVKFYVNGQQVTSGVTGANVPDGQMGDNSGETLRIGLHNAGLAPFDGRMDEVAIFDRPLSEFEINLMKNGGVVGGGPILSTLIETDIEGAMFNNNATAYLRMPFTVADASQFDTLTLRMKYNDGFVAYLNGVEIARQNAPATLAWNSTASGERNVADSLEYQELDISHHVGLLTSNETNVLAIQGLNSSVEDPSFLLLPELIAATTTEALRYFPTPTPGAANNSGFVGLVEDTLFSEDRGFYDTPFDVEITSATPGAEIRYTIDGSAPTSSTGTIYGGPITIDTTTTLRAAAFKDAYLPTNVDTQTYIFPEDVIRQPANPPGLPPNWGTYYIGPTGSLVPADYEMNQTIVNSHADTIIDDLKSLPTMSIVMDHDDLFDVQNGIYPNPFFPVAQRERAASIEWFDANGRREWQVDAGIRQFGGWSRHFHATPKKSFALKFKRPYGPTKLDFDLFDENQVDSQIEGTQQFDTVLLRGVFSDAWPDAASPPQYLRDHNARYMQLAMGQPSSHGTWVHLYLNGLYWGIYNPSERPDASFAASYFGGDEAEYDAVKHTGLCGPGCATNNSFEVIDGGEEARLGFQAALNLAAAGLADPDNYEAFKGMVDVENLADYILLEHYVGNVDWPHKNWYANRKREGGEGWQFYVWDSEYTLRNVNDSRLSANNPNTPAFLWNAARQNADFRAMFADRVHKHLFNDGVLQPEANIARYTALADEIDGAIKAEAARWGDNGATRMGPTNYTYAFWDSVKNGILTGYFPQRHAIALSQLRSAGLYPNTDAPEFNQFGGTVDTGFQLTMTAPTGTIFYSIDGSDPRGDTLPTVISRTTLLTESAPATALVPTDGSLGTSWTDVVFDDSSWLSGTTGVGYERSSGYENLIGLDLLSSAIDASLRIDTDGDGQNENDSVYIRVPFEMTEDPATFDYMALKIKYDDGFVAYVNGVEVARSQAPDPVNWDSNATSDHPDASATAFETINISTDVGVLQSGTNVLAIHGLNTSPTSSDMLIIPELEVGIIDDGGGTPSSLEYTGPLTLNESVHVKARVLNGTEWSALTEATFVTEDPSPLRVTEIMYNPVGNDDTEFIELQNTGDAPINLNGTRFTEGIDFTFGDVDLNPGEFVVVARDQVAFATKYDTAGMTIAGEFASTALDNGGEPLKLVDSFERTIMEFEYRDGWYPITDGLGFSLVIQDASLDTATWNDGSSWRPSASLDGSPGADNVTALPPQGAIIINEILSHTDQASGDWIELHNTTDQPIDIGSWFISDDGSIPAKIQIAAETTIPAGGYLVLNEQSDFGVGVDATNGFSLSELGEEISLTAGLPGGDLAGYQVIQDFEAADNGVTHGRYTTSEGRVDFVALTVPTPDDANSVPAVGPVVINEIMYHPATGGDEFIEIHNISGATVPLFDPLRPENTWQLDGAVEYPIPAGTEILSGEYVLVVPIDPEQFRTKNNLPQSVTILGPYSGSLNNNGESVRLEKLGVPELSGDIPEILVDRVRYRPTAPWPTAADGMGPSLERIISSDYGNDPVNWMRSAFGGSPGVFNVGIDTTPPSVPGELQGEIQGTTEIALSWTAAVDHQSSIAEYQIFRGNTLIGAADGNATTFTDGAVPIGLPLSYRVLAVNGDGVVGPKSLPMEFFALQDSNGPTDQYAGTLDTLLSENAPTTNFAAEMTLLVSNDDPEGSDLDSTALLRWDLSDVPAGAVLQSASMTLNVSSSTGQTYDLYQLRRDWVSDQANWNQFAAGQPWQVPGAGGAADRAIDAESILGTIGPGGNGQQTAVLTDAGVQLVQAWLDGTTPNYGFALVPTNETAPTGGGAILDDLIAFYTFDEIVDGQAPDFSANGLNGTIQGTVTTEPGFDAGSFRFNGNAHVVAPININPSVRPRLTMGAWVKTDPVLPGLYKILGHDNGGWDRTIGLDNREGPFRWTSFVGDRRPVTPTVEPVPDQWSFVAAVYDNVARSVTVYIDIDAATTDDPVQAFSEPTNFNAGQTTTAIGNLRPDNFNEGFLGQMDNVFFFNDALTAEEMEQLRNSGAGFFAEGGLEFDSSESSTPADRPRLTLTYNIDLVADFNFDSFVNATDIDLLVDAVNNNSAEVQFDLDGSGQLDEGDINYLVTVILGTWPGDANLDRNVDGVDFGIWDTNTFQTLRGWATADFNGDGVTDGSDFNIWNEHKFMSLPAGAESEATGRTPRAPLAAEIPQHLAVDVLLANPHLHRETPWSQTANDTGRATGSSIGMENSPHGTIDGDRETYEMVDRQFTIRGEPGESLGRSADVEQWKHERLRQRWHLEVDRAFDQLGGREKGDRTLFFAADHQVRTEWGAVGIRSFG